MSPFRSPEGDDWVRFQVGNPVVVGEDEVELIGKEEFRQTSRVWTLVDANHDRLEFVRPGLPPVEIAFQSGADANGFLDWLRQCTAPNLRLNSDRKLRVAGHRADLTPTEVLGLTVEPQGPGVTP